MLTCRWPLLIVVATLAAAGEGPWPAPVAGFVAPAAGEHPRLFFRKADLPRLKARAQTPEGTVIIQRLRFLLDGGDGTTLPTAYNPKRGKQPDGSGEFAAATPHGKGFTLWHGAGYGLLFHLTGEQKYGDLGRQCVEKMLEGQRDRDNRYSFRDPMGALRAGPSLGAMAMCYDLCCDAWDDAFRQTVAKAMLAYNEGPNLSMDDLAAGKRHGPHSNHWGGEIGGAALALLAITGDAGVDQGRVDSLLKVVDGNLKRQLSEGFGDGGFFQEGQGPGQIGSDTAFIPALQAMRVAHGQDYITPSRTAFNITMIRCYELVAKPGGGYHYPLYKGGGYGTEAFERGEKPPKGVSNAGQFVQGFGAILPEQRGALLWTFNNVIEPDPATRTYDTVSPYPHRAVLALVNWPIGEPEKNPAQTPALTRALHDSLHHYFVFRNRWQDSDDILVTGLWGARSDVGNRPVMIWGLGEKLEWKISTLQKSSKLVGVKPDGSGVAVLGAFSLGVDYSKSSGADALIVAAGQGVGAGPNGKKAKGGTLSAGGTTFGWLALSSSGQFPEVKADGDALVAGGQRVTFKEGAIAFAK